MDTDSSSADTLPNGDSTTSSAGSRFERHPRFATPERSKPAAPTAPCSARLAS